MPCRRALLALLLFVVLVPTTSAQQRLAAVASDTLTVVWRQNVPVVASLDASPDGTLLATGIDRSAFGPGSSQPIEIRYWDAATGDSLRSIIATSELRFRAPYQVDFIDDPDGDGLSLFAIHNFTSCIGQGGCSSSGRLRRWRVEGDLSGPPLSDLYFSRSGTALAAQGPFVTFGRYVNGTENFFVYETDASTPLYTQIYSATGSVLDQAVFSPDTTLLVTTRDFAEQVIVRSVERWAPDEFLDLGGFFRTATRPAFSPDGSLLAVGVYDNTDAGIFLFRTSDWEQIGFFPLEGDEGSVLPVFTADGAHIVGLTGAFRYLSPLSGLRVFRAPGDLPRCRRRARLRRADRAGPRGP